MTTLYAPYLILHKVRGEPAFDIGEEILSDFWIVPTSGHRAYPWRKWRLDDLIDASDINNNGHHEYPYTHFEDEFPPDWRDHYAVNDRKRKIERAILDAAAIMADLDLKAEDLNAALAAVLEQRKCP